MEMVSVEQHGWVTLVKLNHGVTNALNPKVVYELEAILRRVREDEAVKGLVLASSNEKFFSIGFDIPELFEMNREDFKWFYRSFNGICMDLFTLPKPTVAAMTGHAIAAGCILALCCDYRFMAQGHKLMGLNEVKLGLPVPYFPDRLLHAPAGIRRAREMMESGNEKILIAVFSRKYYNTPYCVFAWLGILFLLFNTFILIPSSTVGRVPVTELTIGFCWKGIDK
jgi:enoyl-CoA hydratase/carnithine racemase